MDGLTYPKDYNIIKSKIWIIIAFILWVQFSFSQNVGIGTTTPAASALLEIKSTTKGFLMPRMTTTQRNAIVSPVVGLQIFNLDDQCMDTYDGANWIKNCGLQMTGSTIDPTTNVWTKMAGPDPNTYDIVYGTFSFAINGKGYVLGLNNSNASFNLFEYSPADNRWVQKANFPGEPRDLAVVFAIGNKGYFGGGQGLQNGDLLNDFWEYDPVLNVWTQKGNYKGIPIAGAASFSVGNKGYVVAGADYNQNYDSVWQYEPSNDTWTKKNNFPGGARFNPVGFSIGAKGYLGLNYGNNDFWEYNPVNDSWTRKANFPGAERTAAVGFYIGNKGYIGAGKNSSSGQTINDFWEYNPVDDTWRQRATFAGLSREFAAGFGIGEKGYLGLGRVWSKDLWEYTPEIVRTTYSSNPVSLTDKLITDGRWSGTNKVVYSDSGVNIGLGTKVPLAKLDVDGGIRTKYSGSVVTLPLSAGVQTVNLTISPLPFDWDFTNTMLQVSNADGETGIIYQAKLTSPTNIKLTYNAITPGQVRFNYIVFKL